MESFRMDAPPFPSLPGAEDQHRRDACLTVAVELLRFDWRPTQLRLLLAALADAGPVSRRTWAVRAGVPANHLAEVVGECSRLGGLRPEGGPEGLSLFVQPPEFWRVTPLAEVAVFSDAWQGPGRQRRMALVTEAPGLAEAMSAGGAIANSRSPIAEANARNPGGKVPLPITGIRERVPDSGCDVSTTFRRSDVFDPKRLTSKRGEGIDHHSRDGCATAELSERVRVFVGERDWRRYWENEEAQSIFSDAVRAAVLSSSLRYCQASIREGVRVRKNTGAMLWEDYKRGLGKAVAR